MPPKKKTPAKRPNTAGAAANKNWESALTDAPFEEVSWRACVSLVVGSSPEDEELVRALSSATRQRKLFDFLTWDNTHSKIHELGNPKAKKTDGIPMFYEVTEPAKALLDAGEEIPPDLMAKILKFQLLQIKTNDQQRREAEQAEDKKAKEYPLPGRKEKGGAKVAEKKAPPSPVPREKKTTLKRRDDVEPPNFIDDEPDDGPQHYILVLGFYQPHLIAALHAIGVHVSTVIKLRSENRQSSEEQQEEHREQSLTPSQGLDAEADEHVVAELAAQTRKLNLFWTGLREVLDSGPPESRLHDVAQLSYTVPKVSAPFHSQDPEAEMEMGIQIFEGVAHLIYDCLEWQRQHQHYLDNVKLISIPTVAGMDTQHAEKPVQKEIPADQETMQPPLSKDVDMRFYSNLLDLVPPEASSVPLIMHCMLEQVMIAAEESHVAEEHKSNSGPGLDHELIGFMLQSFLPLAHTKEERSHMLNGLLTAAQSEEDMKRLKETFGDEETQKKTEQPLVIRHHNERDLRLHDIKGAQGFDPAAVELSMMRLSPAWKLIHSGAQQRHSNSCWMAIKQQLQHYCADDVMSWPEVERWFYQSVFESMPLTGLDPKGVLLNGPGPLVEPEPAQQHTPRIIPWDNPLSYAKQHFNNLRSKGQMFLTEDPGNTEISGRVWSQLDLADIQRCRLRSLFDWHYAEHHDASIFPQVLQVATEEYRCLDTFRGSHNNVLYIFCHNPMSPYRQCKEFWDVALHTDVRFRKYLEHVADTISDWTKEEDLKREAMLKLGNLSPTETDERTTDSEEEEEGTLEPIIRKDSLKAWKLEQEQRKEDEMAKKSRKESTPKGKQQRQKEEVKSTNNKKNKTSSGGKKSRAETAGSSAKTPAECVTAPVPPVMNAEPHSTEEPSRGFTGYSMDGKLIHVSGCLQYLFPSDGGHITVESICYVEGSSLMKVAVKKDGHHFYTHINQVVADPAAPQPEDKGTNGRKDDIEVSGFVALKRVKHGSLTAVLDNGVRISYSFYGPTGECIVRPQETEGGARENSTPIPASTHCTNGASRDSDPSQTQSPSSHTRPPESHASQTHMDTQKEHMCEDQPPLPSNPFNSLNLSVANGLLLQFLREDTQGVTSEEQGMLVKQSFPLHGSGSVGQLQDPALSQELSRIVTSQGAVIRYMRDGSTEVLFADGSVSFSPDSGPVWVPDSEVEEENSSQESEDKKTEQSSEKEADAQRGYWSTTTPSGERIYTVGTTHKHLPTTPLLTFKATDPITHEVMLNREDLVVSVQNPDGSLSVEYADGTRITTLYQHRHRDTPQHILLHTEEQRESVTLKSTPECACGCAECVCVTRCTDNFIDNVHIQDACDSSEKISRDSPGKPPEEGAGHSCAKASEGERACGREGSEESVFVAENGRSACETGKGSVSTKEKVVVVEKEGCSTVVMYPEQHAAHVFLADGTFVIGNNQGAYQVFPSSVGLLHIQADGKCVYSSDPLLTPSPKGGTPSNQPGSYTMSHTDRVACDITDPDGNHFQVMEDGQLSVLNFSPAPSTLQQEVEEPEEEVDREVARINIKQECSPRLFLVHEDGSGTELLSYETVEELLYQAYSDPTVALLKEPLPETQGEFGITILKPGHQSVWSKWLLGKQHPDITPPNLRNRSWHDFPRTEENSPGPIFGTNMGRGLTLRERSGGSAAQRQPVRNCPKVLEMRELYQHRPLTTRLKKTVDTRLKKYIESLIEREQQSEEMRVKDPRTEEESGHASDLLNLVLYFAEEEDAGHTSDKRNSVDIISLYSQGVGGANEQSDISEDATTVTSDSFTHAKGSKWSERLVQHRREMCEEQACKEALRKKNVVPFFHPENSPLHLNLLQHQAPDMRSLSMDVPPIPKSDRAEAFLKDAPQESTPRPLNPTPSKSASHAAGSKRKLEKRPTNPTPQTVGESSVGAASGHSKSVQVDVTGKPRKTKVKLPASILSCKPSTLPNQQFLSVEDPVRRRCRTISLTNPNVIIRGFHFLPSRVDFGTLQEGTTSAISVKMMNVGVDTCRFHVKQPPPATGLRIIYTPGPVAAGLHVELQVQLFAMCAVQAGEAEPKKCISQDVIIHSETEILYLPVTATILPQRLYELWLQDHKSTRDKNGSRFRQLSFHLPGEQRGHTDDPAPNPSRSTGHPDVSTSL